MPLPKTPWKTSEYLHDFCLFHSTTIFLRGSKNREIVEYSMFSLIIQEFCLLIFVPWWKLMLLISFYNFCATIKLDVHNFTVQFSCNSFTKVENASMELSLELRKSVHVALYFISYIFIMTQNLRSWWHLP